jgi:hypothetical protein
LIYADIVHFSDTEGAYLPDARADTLARLVEVGGPALFALTDDAKLQTPGMRRVLIEDRSSLEGDAGAVLPQVPEHRRGACTP